MADRTIDEVAGTTFDLVVLPGGMPGAEHLRDSPELVEILRRQRAEGRPYAAICAAPAVALAPHGLLDGRRATCHPAFEDRLPDREAAASRVVVDGPLATSRGPGTALEFALELVALLFGREKAEAVAAPMIVR
jgi:4-methyl-5(b-hydroxyethyl)-thiazole monophosphate biosynthesis